jgi:glycosyltransferase involved in cell wall biosynthesis
MSQRKKILVFIDWFLPGTKAGGPVRSCVNMIEQLQNEYDFSVVTRDTDYTESNPYAAVKSNQWNVLPDGKRVYYISNDRLNRNTIGEIISDEKPDIVYLNGIWSQPFTIWPLLELKKCSPQAKIILAVRGMLAPSALAIKSLKKKIFLQYAKWKSIYTNLVFHCTNEKEASETKSVFGDKAICFVAGNLPRTNVHDIQPHNKSGERLKIISIARIAPEKNTLYALEVLSKLTIPVQADFYGSIYDHAYFDQCKLMLGKMAASVKVQFHDSVDSEKIYDLLTQYDLLFLPSRGENFGHIILESMQAGTPVLISDQTPWVNLEKVNAGIDFVLHRPDAFVSAINFFYEMNEEVYRFWSEGAISKAREYTEKNSLLSDYRTLFNNG